ncbi:MAG: tetratricopeptide repeat protein [Thermoanaerobaculia bacterium]|nr:tetratricopeptide repeat protein [Thermoanaerobaculia bacterium]
MSSHLTRKEMKRDEVRDFIARSMDFVQEHHRRILQIVAAVVGIVVVSAVVTVLLGSREAKAQESLSRALLLYGAVIDPVEPDPDHETAPSFATEGERRTAAQGAFQDIVDSHGGTAAGAVARVYLGEIALATGDPERARRLWGEFLDGSADHVLAGSVILNLVRLDREDGNYDGAIARLEADLDSSRSALPQDVVLFELGETFEIAGRGDDARATFQRLLDEHPASSYAAEARRSLTS